MSKSLEKDTYFVAVKVFLKKDNSLLIMKDKFGEWDLPGGRIKKDEFNTPLDQIIKRKMSEEIGNNVEYEINQPVVFFRHQREEVDLNREIVRIFAVGYEGVLKSGQVKMSDMFTEMKWVNLKTFKPEEYFKGGWLKGVQDYLKISNN